MVITNTGTIGGATDGSTRGFLVFHGDNRSVSGISSDRRGFLWISEVVEVWQGFLMIDRDFSGFDGIAIGVEGSFILIGTLMESSYCFPFLGFG
jgi:hypothetical protein